MQRSIHFAVMMTIRRPAGAWFFVACLTAGLSACMGGCRSAGGAGDAHVAYQNSTIDALLDGNYDGEVTFAELGRKGDFGLGTFDALDGEMVAIDGRFYQVRSDGHVSIVPPSMRTPFSIVTFFRADVNTTLSRSLNLREMEKQLDDLRAGRGDGHAFAIMIRGTFAMVRTRSVPRQPPPYRPLVEVVKEQATFNLENVSGTMVGFWFPASLRHINVPGYHFHFLTDDHRAGGHVLDAKLTQGKASLCEITTLEIALPRRAPTTRPMNATDRGNELEQVEK